MEWIKLQFLDFLQERKGRFKPNDSSIRGLKRIDKIDFSGNIYLSEKPSKTDMIIVKDGDLVISGINVEKGAMAIFQGKEDVIATIHYSSYIYNEEVIDLEFLKHFLKSQEFKNILKEQVPGGIKTEIKPKHLLPLKLTIPKKIEDQRIIVKHLNYLNVKITEVSSEQENQIKLISQLRQAFLREAMQGKLVSNETSDGKTGADLLYEIKAEKARLIKEKKIKKYKPLPPISEDEIPFDIPENWTWCKLENITSKVGSGSTPKGGDYSEKGYPFFRSQNIQNNELVYNDIKFININTHKKMNGTIVFANDLLLNITGGSLGRCALVPMNFEEGNVSQHVCIIRGITLNSQFFHYLVLSPYFQGKIFQSTTGAGREGLPKYNLEQFCVPLPPIEIQEHIVDKLNGLMQYCDNLENSIKESQQYNEMLLQQVLREALEGKEESKTHLKVNKTCDNNDTAILASYIIQELNTPDFGRTKLQKILHLTEYHCKLETSLQYYKKTAGPYSKNLENDIEKILKRNKLYDNKKEELKNSDKSKVNYIPLSGAKQINSFFIKEFKDQKKNIDNLLEKFNDKPMEFCEMISTMYAVWNNRLIKGEKIDSEELKKDFLAWDPQKIKFLDKLDYSIEWIKKESLEPTGFGKYIDKQ